MKKRGAAEHPEAGARYGKGFQKLHAWTCPKPPKCPTDFVPCEWESRVLDYVDEVPDDYEVLWIIDLEKRYDPTLFFEHLEERYSAFCPKGNTWYKFAKQFSDLDEKPKLALFNFTHISSARLKKERLYSFINNLKDGRLFIPQWHSKTIHFDRPHTVCYSTYEPDYEMYSEPRWNIMRLS
jgi:hypothetical protein